MGCCFAKEADATQPDQKAITAEESAASPGAADGAPEPLSASASKAKKGVASSRTSAPKATSGETVNPASNPDPNPPTDNQSTAPTAPSGSTPASGPQAPPPGWMGTPEIDDEDEGEYSAAERASGPRAVKNLPGGNGYISGTRKDQEISEGVMDRIKGLEAAGLQTKKRLGNKMLSPRIITDVKETWDKEGNVTRQMTHYIEEPDGTKHTTKETVYIAVGEPDPMEEEADPVEVVANQ